MNIIINVDKTTEITLPEYAGLGELIYSTDTNTFYVGQGEGIKLKQMAKVSPNQGVLDLLADDGQGLKYAGKIIANKELIDSTLGVTPLETSAQDIKGAINEVLTTVVDGLANLNNLLV